MKSPRLKFVFVALLAIAAPVLAQEDISPALSDGAAAASELPAQALTPQITFQLLYGEIALNRGNVALAMQAYLDLAQTTRDPRIAKRAAEIALYARQQDAALHAAQLWVEFAPDSVPARQMLVGMLVAGNRIDALTPQLTQLLALEKDNVGNALLQVGRMLTRLTDHVAMLRLAQDVTAPYDALPEAHFARAQVAQVAGDEARTAAEIDRALSLRPDWDQAVLVKAHLLQKKPAQAEELLRRYLDGHAQAREVRLAYARTLVGDNRYEEARRQFRTLLEGHENDPEVLYAVAILSLQLKDRAEAETDFKRLLQLGYGDANGIRVQLGQIAEEDKRWDEALRWYGDVTAGEQYVPSRARAANVLAQQGRLDDGRRLLHDAAAASPNDRAQLQIAEATLLRDAGRPQDAYAVLEGGLGESPNQTDLLYEAALMAERLGKPDVLERNLRRLIKLKPDSAQAYNALGYSFADRNERLDEAQTLIDQALSLAPDDPFILDSKGWVLYRRGDGKGALAILQRAFALRADPEIAAHIGEVQWSLGRRADAEKTWRDAAKSNPGNEALTAVMKKFTP
jgi:tetratricopeptide (TPR) repeat protein